MHPLAYSDVPTEVHSAPIFNVRRTNRNVQPKTLKLSLDQLQMNSKLQKGDARRDTHGCQQENTKKLIHSPLSANSPKAKTTYDALPKLCAGTNGDQDQNRIIRKSPSCLSVRLLKNAVKRTYHPADHPKILHLNKTSSISLHSPSPPKSSRSLVRVQDNVRLTRPHSKLSCISNEMKSVVTSSTSRSDDQIVLHSTKRLLQQPTYSQGNNVKRQSHIPVIRGLKKRTSVLSVCSHATEPAMIIPEISVETNLNCTARSESQQCTNRSAQSFSKMKSIQLAEDDEKPICISQHSIRLRAHDVRKPTVDFGRRMRVPRADLSRIRISEAPGLKALDQPTIRQCERKRKIFKDLQENVKVGQVAIPNTSSSISYMFLYMSILCGIGLMMIAYYL